MKFNSVRLPVLLSTALCVAGGAMWAILHLSSTGKIEPPKKIVLLVLDSVRADYMSMYGGPAEATPLLNEFSRTSVVFERALSTAPWTLPSVASLFTSTYPDEHEMVDPTYHPSNYGAERPDAIPKLPDEIKSLG